jgi:hypothetical protein
MSIAVSLSLPQPERRAGRWAALSAALSVVVLFAALVVANSSSAPQVRGPREAAHVDQISQLESFHDEPGTQLLAAGLRGFGLVVGIGVGVYLFWLVRRRGAAVHRAVLWTAIAGPLLVTAATLFGFFAFRDVSDAFYASGPRTAERASQLIDDAGRLRLAGVFDIASRIVFAAWVAVLSLRMMRLQLLTTFLGYWGLGAAGALILLPVGDAMYIGWLASMAFMAYGWWPGGLPEGWTQAKPAAADP